MSKLQLSELVGNPAIRTRLIIAHGAAQLHNRAMGHILFSGLAGCGKTSTAQAVAGLSGAPFFELGAEALRSAEDLVKVFNKFPDDGYNPVTGEKFGTIQPAILFIDEAHRLSLKSEEMLGIAMENFRHTYMEGRGKNKRSEVIWVPEFTLVCATTKEGELSKPFRDRFMSGFVFGSYTFEESIEIVNLHASKRNIPIDQESVREIAQRGRGTPRILVRYLVNMHDNMTFLGRKSITLDLVDSQFKLMEIDPIGLTQPDIVILEDLYYAEGPKGLDSLAVKTNLDPKTISEVNEPFLILQGFIERGRSGRIITDLGIKHLADQGHIDPPGHESGGRVLHKAKR